MKKSAKILALVLAVVLTAACFAGCGSSDKSDNAAGKSDTLKIGGIGPLTGGAAVYGQAVKNAADLAVKEINAAGGVNGKQIEFNFQDDENDAEKSLNAYNNLKDWGMQVLMGTVTTTPALAVSEKTAQDNMFELTPSASAEKVIANDNCFQVCFTDPNQGKASADYIADNSLATKIAVIYNSSDAYSSGIYETFKTESGVKGLNIVSEESFTEDSKTDFSVQLGKAKSAGADLVFLPIYAQEASLILKQAQTLGFETKFFGCDGLDGILEIENFDTALAENVMLLTPFAADAADDATQKFVSAYKSAYGETPNQFAADAYDAIYIIAKCMEKGNVTPDMDVAAINTALKAQITSISYDGLTGSGMTWDASGAVNKYPKAVKIVNGAYVSMDK